MNIDTDVVMMIGGATYYTNGDTICWNFECKCEHKGYCGTCPKQIDYDNFFL